MYKLLKILIVVLITLYPFCIYFGLNYFSPSQLGLFLLAVFGVRLLFVPRGYSEKTWPVMLTIIIGACLAGFSWLFDSPEFLFWYPVGLNIALLVLFVVSIIYPPTIVERMASLTQKKLSTGMVAYTRKVTIVWSLFFTMNAVIATWSVLVEDLQIWALYNGLLAYLIMGLIFSVEYLVRRIVRAKNAEL